MSRLIFAAWATLILSLAYPASADQSDNRLDTLFAALQTSADVSAARPIEGLIWEIWGEAEEGEPAMLFEQGNFAMATRDFVGAIDQFSQLTEIAPEFAEGWNKRATVYYLVGQYESSIADIQRTLALEPRHFGALSGLGLVMMRLDKPELALKSFKAAIEIHPHMPSAKAHIEMLEERIDGEPL